VIQNFQAQI